MKNVLQGNLRKDRAKEYTNLELFRGSGGTNFENFSASLHPTFAGPMCVPVCPKKLWIRHWLKTQREPYYLGPHWVTERGLYHCET